jgi:hypothetical protein
MNQFGYRVILSHLTDFIESKFESKCTLIQDNDSKHSSKICRNFLADKNVSWVIFLKNLKKNISLILNNKGKNASILTGYKYYRISMGFTKATCKKKVLQNKARISK